MKIYVASSWRNALQPDVVGALRDDGHEVYDFRNPAPGVHGFSWKEVGDTSTVVKYLKALRHSRSSAGFGLDKMGLDWADVCILVLPCGRSAHLEAGYMAGKGKKVYVLLSEVGFEPELMYLLCTRITADFDELREWLL